MSQPASYMASEFPPGVKDFHYAPIWDLHLFGIDLAITKLTLLTWIAILGISVFFLLAVRKPKLVPGRMQWMGESAYGFIRDGMARPMIGEEGVRFAPYLTTLFLFIVANNIYGVIPIAQISPTAKISLPVVLALLSFVLFNWIGIRKHGVAKYFRNILFPPSVPAWLYPLLTPIEFFSTLVVRPVTLAVRLFANMFAGHLLLLVFTLGGIALLTSENFLLKGFSFFSFLLAIALSLFEFMVQLVQAYVFTILTASYLQGALADEH
ncbi:MAG TPA: F0F1 ATP synthase subunit A [Mycobacteriales bacterium]|nr:F0F1 ATP synthase subunit A [Mycobacteriales bacterium]